MTLTIDMIRALFLDDGHRRPADKLPRRVRNAQAAYFVPSPGTKTSGSVGRECRTDSESRRNCRAVSMEVYLLAVDGPRETRLIYHDRSGRGIYN